MRTLALILITCAITGLAVWALMGGLDAQRVAGIQKNQGEGDRPLVTEADMRNKLTKVKMDRDRALKQIRHLKRNREENIDFLRNEGIRKVADATTPATKMALHNLKGWTESIAKLEEQMPFYDKAISRLEGMLTRMEQERISESAGLGEDELIDLLALQKDLDDRLGINDDDIFQNAKIDNLIDDLLTDDAPSADEGNQEENKDVQLELNR